MYDHHVTPYRLTMTRWVLGRVDMDGCDWDGVSHFFYSVSSTLSRRIPQIFFAYTFTRAQNPYIPYSTFLDKRQIVVVSLISGCESIRPTILIKYKWIWRVTSSFYIFVFEIFWWLSDHKLWCSLMRSKPCTSPPKLGHSFPPSTSKWVWDNKRGDSRQDQLEFSPKYVLLAPFSG